MLLVRIFSATETYRDDTEFRITKVAEIHSMTRVSLTNVGCPIGAPNTSVQAGLRTLRVFFGHEGIIIVVIPVIEPLRHIPTNVKETVTIGWE